MGLSSGQPAQQGDEDSQPGEPPEPRPVLPGHAAVTLGFADLDPAQWAWDPDDSLLLLDLAVPVDDIGAVLQSALDQLSA